MRPESVPITVVVVSCNEAALLDRCLSRLGWAEELIVLDMHSEDRTTDVAERAGASVIAVDRVPYAEMVRQVAIDAARHQWTLHVDPDELVPPSMRDEVADLLLRFSDAAAVRWPTREFAFGRPLSQLMTSSAKLVMFNRSHARFDAEQRPHQEPVFAGFVLDGRELGVSPIEHHSYRTVSQSVEKLVRYSAAGVGFQTLPPSSTFELPRLLFRRVFLDAAWRDGVTGIRIASLLAVHDFIAILAAREQEEATLRDLDPSVVRTLEILRSATSAAIQIRHRIGGRLGRGPNAT